MIFLTLLIIPIVIALCFFLVGGKKVTWKEFLIQCGVQFIIVGISILCIYFSNVTDTEIWNGYVTDKKQVKVGCRHSYRCMCVTMSCGKDCTTTVCQTCYDHDHDFDWEVYTNIEHTYDIDTLDSQGLKEPPRWTNVVIGEPISIKKKFENFIKASSDTLFRKKELTNEYTNLIPQYPDNIYDYYRLDRVLMVGTNISNVREWNKNLSELNGQLGKTKEANIILIFTNLPDKYLYSLEQRWLGGKKNDIIIITGLEDNNITWVGVIAWCKDNIVKVKLRDDLLELKELNQVKFLEIVKADVSTYYERQSFEEYRYLITSITPSFGEWLTAMIIGSLIAFGIGVYLYNNEYESNS